MTVLANPPELLTCKPGDICTVRTPGFAAKVIRFGEHLRGWPDRDNHVVGIHHVDNSGTVWGIEGRPGGVGWVDVATYFTGPSGRYALTNRLQPKTDQERLIICQVAEQLLKTGYDWDAIAQDAVIDLDLPLLWHERWNGTTPPAHVVCSSLYAWAYHKANLAHPVQEDMRHIEPANWSAFILESSWEHSS